MEGLDPDASPGTAEALDAMPRASGEAAGKTDRAASARSEIPFVLSISVPGLGHALYGAPAAGIAAVILSLILVLACIYAFVVTLFLFLGGQPVLRPLIVLGGLLTYGLVYTGLVAWDARELEDREGQVTAFMHGALGSAVVVLIISFWLLQ